MCVQVVSVLSVGVAAASAAAVVGTTPPIGGGGGVALLLLSFPIYGYSATKSQSVGDWFYDAAAGAVAVAVAIAIAMIRFCNCHARCRHKGMNGKTEPCMYDCWTIGSGLLLKTEPFPSHIVTTLLLLCHFLRPSPPPKVGGLASSFLCWQIKDGRSFLPSFLVNDG